MAERLRFGSMGISVEGEKHILEDLVRVVREAEHEGIEACNPVSDMIYSIEVGLQLNGMGRDVADLDEAEARAPASRLDRLKAYKSNEAALAQADELKKVQEADALIGKIKGLQPRIQELIATANACLDSGVEINRSHKDHSQYSDKWDRGTFCTNGISHKIGFVWQYANNKFIGRIDAMGIDGGGANGEHYLRTDGNIVASRTGRGHDSGYEQPDIFQLKSFLKSFDDFESAFYKYVDDLLDKQAREAESKLGVAADALVKASERLNLFGLSQEVYDDLRQKGMAHADVSAAVKDWGAAAVERGYDLFSCSGSDVVVEGAIVVEMIGELERFASDFEACRQAEKDGYKFINDMDGLEKGCYLDTPENRALCEKWLKEHPEYRVENWLDLNSDYGKKYVAQFGPVISTKNWKFPLAPQGMDLYQKWVKMYNEASRAGTLDGTSSLEENIKSVEDAGGWMLLTYEDTALEVIGDWRRDFTEETCWDFSLADIQMVLEKCFGFERDFPTYEEIREDYDMFVALSKDVRTPEQAIDFADAHHTFAEVNGDSAHWFKNMSDKSVEQGGNAWTVEWIRYEAFRCLSFIYDYLDGHPQFDVYRYDGEPFAIDFMMKDLTEEKYEELADRRRDKFLEERANSKIDSLVAHASIRAGKEGTHLAPEKVGNAVRGSEILSME